MKLFEVEIYSHHFVVTKASATGAQVISNFARDYIQYELVKENRVWKRKGTKIFGAKTVSKNETRFHIGSYKHWKYFLAEQGIPESSYIETKFGYYPVHPIDITFTTDKQPRDYQVEINKYNMSPLPSKRKFVGISPGLGKAVRNGTLVRIPGGWKAIELLNPGDYVIASDGTLTVVAGVYPQGKKELYRVKFEDGRAREFCGEHIWSVIDESQPARQQARDVTTLELKALLEVNQGKVSIPLPALEHSGTEIVTPIPPYVLGAIYATSSVTDDLLTVATATDQVRAMLMDKLGPVKARVVGGYWVEFTDATTLSLLSQLGYLDDRALPYEYLNAVASMRKELLSGLLDFNGSIRDQGNLKVIIFETGYQQLAKDVQYLVRSLQGKATLTTVVGDYNDSIYRVKINIDDPWQYFNDEVKAGQLSNKHQVTPFSRKLAAVSVIPTELEEATCISIDHPSKLFVVEDFIVTHNTFIAGWMAAQLGGRIVSFLKPEFLEKWPGDLKELLGIELEETLVIQGSAQLMSVISQAKEGTLEAKAVLVSNRTFQNFITLYEKHGNEVLNMGYDCLPQEFCQVLGASLRIIDEVHKDFHCNFKIDLYTHIEWSISLTATLISDDTFISRMHEIAYPKDERCKVIVEHKYVHTTALRYKINKPDKLRTSEFGSTNYSHIAFEKNFFKNDRLMRSYLELIRDRFDLQYLIRKQSGQKCLIYAASIKMCTFITEYLQDRYPELKIRRFVENDPYENLMESDVAISTIGSAGTGHDIKNLITVLLTTAIASTATNIQGFGRLRDIPGVETVFEYFVCLGILKHMDYHFKKEILLKEKALVTRVEDYPHTLSS